MRVIMKYLPKLDISSISLERSWSKYAFQSHCMFHASPTKEHISTSSLKMITRMLDKHQNAYSKQEIQRGGGGN